MFTPTMEEPDFGTPIKVIPEERRYHTTKKQGVVNVKFDKMKERKFVLQNSPYPGNDGFAPPNTHEARFKSFDIKLESIGKRNSSLAPKIEGYSKRQELWPVMDLPDS